MSHLFRTAAVVVALCAASAAWAQDQGAASSAAARRDQLAKVREELADPDPLMRLANMEAIIASGDGLRIQLALRAAFSSDDADLRGLAMRAYMASTQQLEFDVKLPPAVQQQYDAAAGDPDAMEKLFKRLFYVRIMAAENFHIRIALDNYAIGQNSGTVEAYDKAPFVLSGDRFTTHLRFRLSNYFPTCDLEFAPSTALRLEGTLWCDAFGAGAPRLPISASLF